MVRMVTTTVMLSPCPPASRRVFNNSDKLSRRASLPGAACTKHFECSVFHSLLTSPQGLTITTSILQLRTDTEPAQVTELGKEKAVRASRCQAAIVRTAHLLRRNIEGDGPHVHLDEAVSAWQDKKQTCNTQDQGERLGSARPWSVLWNS